MGIPTGSCAAVSFLPMNEQPNLDAMLLEIDQSLRQAQTPEDYQRALALAINCFSLSILRLHSAIDKLLLEPPPVGDLMSHDRH